MEIALIAAVAENGVIGRDGEMPWHYPEDLKHFKEETMGSPVIIGRVTYESIVEATGGPLEDRTTIVLTRNPDRVDTNPGSGSDDGLQSMQDATEVYTARVPAEAVAIALSEEADEAFVAGGASVYEQFLPVADTLVMTKIHESYEGDTRFPDYDESEWEETSRDTGEELSFVTYRRAAATSKRPSEHFSEPE